jgi:hypothetical protein
VGQQGQVRSRALAALIKKVNRMTQQLQLDSAQKDGDTKNLRRPKHRAGTIYVMAMGTSLIVTCLAIASLQAVRVQRRMNDFASQAASAKEIARSGIEFVQHQILTDSAWRTRFINGTPISRTTTGGSFTVTLTDPADGNIANRTSDPITVSSIGSFGTARQTVTAYLEPQNQIFEACRSAIYATQDIIFSDCEITSNQWAYSGDEIKGLLGADIDMNCLGANGFSGNGFLRRKFAGGVWPMETPDFIPSSTNYVGKYYIDNAVALAANDLPTGGTELVVNGGFETNTANWFPFSGCTLTRDTAVRRTGSAACLVSGRSSVFSTPSQDITEHMVKNRNYRISFWVRSVEEQDFRPEIRIRSTNWVFQVFLLGNRTTVNAGTWTLVSSNIRVNWSGALVGAELRISTSKQSNYHFDDVSLLNEDRAVGTRYIENVLLGRGSNPFGSKITSANGIYSIDAIGQDLLIRDCRINGTIVVLNANKVNLENSISWEPSGRNFPALIANAPVEDQTLNNTLSEATIGVNLNPATSPYRDSSNTTVSDSYPSTIVGPIVSTGDILLEGEATLTGPVMTPRRVNVESEELSINVQSDIILNPPPGFFRDPPTMRLIPSSLQ